MEMRVEDNQLFVIGAGLGRTGTNSLKEALELIYGEPCYHMYEVLINHNDHCRRWVEVDDEINNSVEGNVDSSKFHKLFRDYRCAVDFPNSPYYQQMMVTYPEAKIILTVRDAHTWMESARATILPLPDFGKGSWMEHYVMGFKFSSHFLPMRRRIWRRALGRDIDLSNDEMVMKRFEEWNDFVKRTVPPDKLLVFNVKDGWEPLCRFLQKPVPNVPFPRVNQRHIIATNFGKARHVCRILSWVTPLVPISVLVILLIVLLAVLL